MPVYHPGVNHGHSPSGKWSTVQMSPNSSSELNTLCPRLSPKGLVDAAILFRFLDKPIARAHLNWYLSGTGLDFIEDANIKKMLTSDAGIQAVIQAALPPGRTSGVFTTFRKIEQSDYSDQDLRFAFGAIDRLDIEADFAAGTVHVWFQDRYEWHPFYPGLYTVLAGDAPARDTNCVHAAMVELKSTGAKDFWMRGEATAPLGVLKPGSAAPVGCGL
jgi:hypothetical protein